MQDKNGNLYIGEWRDNKKSGKGTLYKLNCNK